MGYVLGKYFQSDYLRDLLWKCFGIVAGSTRYYWDGLRVCAVVADVEVVAHIVNVETENVDFVDGLFVYYFDLCCRNALLIV